MFTGIVNWVIGGLVAALLASGMWIVYDYKSQASTIQGLKDKLASAQNAAKVAAANVNLRDETIKTLNARLNTRVADVQKTCDLLQDAISDKAAASDQPVSGVLSDILGRIDGDAKTSPPNTKKAKTSP